MPSSIGRSRSDSESSLSSVAEVGIGVGDPITSVASSVTSAATGPIKGIGTTVKSDPVSHIGGRVSKSLGDGLTATVTKAENVYSGRVKVYSSSGPVTLQDNETTAVKADKEGKFERRDKLFGKLVTTMINEELAPDDWDQERGINFDLTNLTCKYWSTDAKLVEISIIKDLKENHSFFDAFDAFRVIVFDIKGNRHSSTQEVLDNMLVKAAKAGQNKAALPKRNDFYRDFKKSGSNPNKMPYASAYAEIPESFDHSKKVLFEGRNRLVRKPLKPDEIDKKKEQIDQFKAVYEGLKVTLKQRKEALQSTTSPPPDLAKHMAAIRALEYQLEGVDQFALSTALAYHGNNHGKALKDDAELLASDLKQFTNRLEKEKQQEIQQFSGTQPYVESADDATYWDMAKNRFTNAATGAANPFRTATTAAVDKFRTRPLFVEPIDEQYHAEIARLLFSGVTDPESDDASFYQRFCKDHRIQNATERYIEDDLMQIMVGNRTDVVGSWGLDGGTKTAIIEAINKVLTP